MTDALFKCSNCFKHKPLHEFYEKRGARSGRQSRCKACNAEVVRGYQSRKRQEMLDRVKIPRDSDEEE